VDSGTQFAVHAPAASSVHICLIDQDGNEDRVELRQHTYGIWHGIISGIGAGQRYGIRASGPWNPRAGLILIAALSGAILVETVFSVPGVGSLMVQSVTEKDLPVVQGLAVCLGAFVIVVNLAVDVVALLVDPRMRYAGKG